MFGEKLGVVQREEVMVNIYIKGKFELTALLNDVWRIVAVKFECVGSRLLRGRLGFERISVCDVVAYGFTEGY